MAVVIEIAGRELAVQFTGTDRWWSLSRGLTVPLAAVTSARPVSRSAALAEKPLLRMPGTYWPGRMVAGSYRAPGRLPELWSVRRADELLSISLTGQGYGKIVLEVPDPAAAARAIEVARTNVTP